MVRSYKMEGQKMKKKGEKYDREEEIEQLEENITPQPPNRVNTEEGASSESKEGKPKTVVDEMPGIPFVAVDTTTDMPGVIFILEKASLEIGKFGKTYQLLSSDQHANFLARNKRKPAEYRPDIAFQMFTRNGHYFKCYFLLPFLEPKVYPSKDVGRRAIQTILDSRVNKCGRLKALYVKTQQGLLLHIKPHARMPRTYKRFAGLMCNCCKNCTSGNGEKLLHVIKNPVEQYLPINCRKLGFSHSSKKLVDMYDYVGTISNELNLVFVVGAMAIGRTDEDYVEDYLSISEYPLSAAYCISMITTALERKWKIL
ncbi:hypothetical protein OROGR_013836 [Orobanche gracilis]